jgi:hypothetical protein
MVMQLPVKRSVSFRHFATAPGIRAAASAFQAGGKFKADVL